MESTLMLSALVAGVALALLFLYLVYRLVWVPYSWIRFFRKQGIPGEPFVPLLGQLPAIRRAKENGTDFYAYEMTLAKKHGPVFFLCRGPEFRLFFYDADAFLQVTSHHSSLSKVPVAYEASALTLLQESFFMSEHANWKRQRRQYNPAFQHSNLETMFREMQDCCRDALKRWLQAIVDVAPTQITDTKTAETTAVIDMARELSELTLEIVVAASFGMRRTNSKQMEHTSNTILSIIDIVQRHFHSGMAFVPGANWLLSKLNQRVREYHTVGRAFLLNTMAHCRKHSQENQGSKARVDVLSVLTAHAAENPDEALSNGLMLLLAGHETTANAICFVLYMLDQHPQWWDAVRQEVFSVCGTDQLPTMKQAWKELPICSAVIAETLRLFPIIPELSRCTVRPMTIDCQGRQIQLPVGTCLIASIVAGHRDPKLWENPDSLQPTRFLRKDWPIPAAYAPFSTGGRNCLGRYFAQLEARLILALIAQRMHIELVSTYQHNPIFSITLRPKYGMPMKIRELTTEEVQHWKTHKTTTEKQRIEEAMSIPIGPPVFGRTTVSPDGPCLEQAKVTDKVSKTSSWYIAPFSKSDYGIRTPWMVRFVALACYAEVARRGANLLFFAKDLESMKQEACIGLWVYTIVYGLETFLAVFFRWVSLQGVHMHHMYEHHLPGFGLGAALSIYVFFYPDSWYALLLDICYMPLSIGFLAQLCEVWSILRTFLPNPDHRDCKIVQRFLGAVLMSALPMTIIAAFRRYVSELYSTSGGVSWSELGIVLLSMYLACIVHPSYVSSHVRALRKLLSSSKVRKD